MSRRLARMSTALLLGAVLAEGGCIHAKDRATGYGTGAPVVTQGLEDVPVAGHRVWLRPHGRGRLVGELLYVEPLGQVAVLSKKGQVETMAVADLRRATVLTDPNAHVWLASAGSATAVLVPITLTTGGFVLFLAPTVGFAGVLAMGIIWAESRVVLRKKELLLLYQYARWPQGKPRPKQEAPPKPEPAPQAPAPEPEPIEPVPFE